MKNMKKCFSILLALVMVFALAATAMAEGDETSDTSSTTNTGSITITNATVGETYEVYRIFDLKYDGTGATTDSETGKVTGGKYNYTVNSAWQGFFADPATTEASGRSYVDIDTKGNVTWKKINDKDADPAAFAKDAIAYAKSHNIDPAQTVVNNLKEGEKADANNEHELVINGLSLGYYLVGTSVGTLCSLDSTNTNAIIKDKNTKPTINKEVKEDNGNSWGDSNDADIGQKVEFKSTLSAKVGAKNYVVHDRMSNGLTFDETSVVVKVNNAALNAWTDGATTWDYKVVTTDLCTGDNPCDFHIEFSESYLNSLTADTSIEITYSAELNESAVIAGEGNPNEIKLTYANDQETVWDKTVTYTWKGAVYKYAMNGEVKKALEGAEFQLTTDEAGTSPIAFTQHTDSDGKVIEATKNTYVVDKPAEGNSSSDLKTITTDSTGKFNIEGLDEGTYYLHETKAPNGYNLLTKPIKVVVSSEVDENDGTKRTGTVKYYTWDTAKDNYDTTGSALSEQSPEIPVENKAGSELPETGGMGTTILYIAGGVLVAAAAVMLIVKRRMAMEK